MLDNTKINNELVVIVALLFTNIISPILAYKIAQRKIKDDYYDKALQNRYKLIYSPLRSLLLETHITGASLGFYFSQRLKKALPYFKKFKIKDGFRRLSKDFCSNPIYEVEFGNDFPIEGIKKIVKKNNEWADTSLMNLIQSADRSTYEKVAYSHDGKPDGLLEIEKFYLAKHIWDTYNRLNKRLIPKA